MPCSSSPPTSIGSPGGSGSWQHPKDVSCLSGRSGCWRAGAALGRRVGGRRREGIATETTVAEERTDGGIGPTVWWQTAAVRLPSSPPLHRSPLTPLRQTHRPAMRVTVPLAAGQPESRGRWRSCRSSSPLSTTYAMRANTKRPGASRHTLKRADHRAVDLQRPPVGRSKDRVPLTAPLLAP